jgi:hypothetical protein
MLKSLGTRRATKAAKTLSELLAEVFTASKLPQLRGKFYPEYFTIGEDGISYDWDGEGDQKDDDYDGYESFDVPFECKPAEFCCGLLEIGNLADDNFTSDPAVNSVLMRVFMACLALEYNMVMATTITSQKVAAGYLAEAGFAAVAEYKSKSTGATITVWLNDLGAKKELPAGDLNLSNFELFR